MEFKQNLRNELKTVLIIGSKSYAPKADESFYPKS